MRTRFRYLPFLLVPAVMLALFAATFTGVHGRDNKIAVKDTYKKYDINQILATSNEKVYLIQNIASGGFMTASGSLTHDPTDESALWSFLHDTDIGAWDIVSVSNAPSSLNIYGGATYNGAVVGLYQVTSDTNSLWKLTNVEIDHPNVFVIESYYVVGQYITCGSSPGDTIVIWDNPTNTQTQWRIVGASSDAVGAGVHALAKFQSHYACGLVGNNWGTDNGPVHGEDPCECMELCIKGEGDAANCVIWTWMNSTAMGAISENGVGVGTCYFGTTTSGAGMIDNCAPPDLCISAELSWDAEYLEGHKKEIATAAVEALPTTVTKTTTPSYCSSLNQQGNLYDIASPSFEQEEEWPSTNSDAYKLISQCLTSSACDPKNFDEDPPPHAKDVRETYATVAGSPKLGVYEFRISNTLMMESLKEQAGQSISPQAWAETQLIMSTEISMIKAVSGAYAVYSDLMVNVQNNLREAFTSVLTILALPADTQVSKPKIKWGSIVCQLLVIIGAVVVTVGTAGSADAVILAGSAITAAAVAGQSAVNGAQNWPRNAPTMAPSAQDDADTLFEYSEVMDMLVYFLETFLLELNDQRSITVSNWGRLQSGNALSLACPVNPESLESLASHTYGAMQWYALGLLMPNKYVIYWQRDYGGLKGPSCYYNGGTGSGDGCSGSSTGCWSLGGFEGDASSFYDCASMGNDKSQELSYNDCYTNVVSSNNKNQQCSAPTRNIWLGEVGAPSSVPSADFFAGLADKYSGPLTTYINARFGTNYIGAKGAWTAFMSQCQYMPKLYIPATSNNQITHSVTAPSQVAVACDVYGIDIPVYAFADCGTNLATQAAGAELTGTCVNGYGQSFGAIDSGINNKYMWSSGNFNQAMYIPNEAKKFANPDDGKLACCMPWTDSLPSQCDYAMCDCFSVQQAKNNNWLPSSTTEHNLAGKNLWTEHCDVDTDTKTTQEMMTTSSGANWTVVIESENNVSFVDAQLAEMS